MPHARNPWFKLVWAIPLALVLLVAVVLAARGIRSLAGTTDPTAAAPGTIRGDFGRDWGTKVQQNLVHGSDSPESADRELALWFD